jgi:hypothetical protein
VAIEKQVGARGHPQNGDGAGFQCAVEDGGTDGVFVREIVPGDQEIRMDQDDRIFRGGACFGEARIVAHAGVYNIGIDAAFGSGRRPADGNQANRKWRGGKNLEMRVTFGPADGNGEFFGMDVVNTGVTKSLNSPIRGAVGRGRTGDSAADGVAEVAKIFFKGRGTECRLNHGGCQIGTGFLNRARTRALRHLR